MDDLGVAHELQRDEPQGRGDVVVLHRVVVALDSGKDEVLDIADIGEPLGDRVRVRQVEADAARRAADLRSARFGRGRVAAGDDDVATLVGVELCNLPPQAARSAHDNDVLARHLPVLLSQPEARAVAGPPVRLSQCECAPAVSMTAIR